MKRGLELVRQFHNKFGIEVNEKIEVLDENTSNMRHALMREENDEYLEACDEQDIEKIADALGDQLYILFGTILSHGLQDLMEDVFVEIHRSNMTKLDKDGNPIINGENGIYDEEKPEGKILKGDSYEPPRIDRILQKYFEDELKKKFLDDELKEHLDKTYSLRDEALKEIIKEKVSEEEYEKLLEFEKMADYFSDRIILKQERTSYDQTRFGVAIDGIDYWIDEKTEESYGESEEVEDDKQEEEATD